MNLIATKKLYQLMSLEDYNAAKNAYIASLAVNYTALSDVEKWDLILNLFKSQLSDADTINLLDLFQTDRKNTSTSLYNLSLHDALQYFEDFYFLYTTNHFNFKLNASKKASLLEAITDAINTCETGINTRFDSILQRYRTDLNWVTTTLYQARYNLLVRLQEMYVQSHNIRDIVSIHVLPMMIKLAIGEGLGLKIEHELQDIHARLLKRADITRFFKEQYPLLFLKDYELDTVDILSHHLLLEIQDLFCPRESNWSERSICIPLNRVEEFSTYIADRMALADFDCYCLGELRPDGLLLKNKNETLSIIRDGIRKKLVQESYFLPFGQLTSDSPLLSELCLRKGIDIALVIELNEAFMNYTDEDAERVRALIQEHSKVILQYPLLLITNVVNHPNLFGLIPPVLKNNADFVGQAIEALEGAIISAINNNTPIEHLTRMLFSLTQSDSSVLTRLSPMLLCHPSFALKLVEKDGLLIRLLPPALRQNEAILNKAIEQNPLARFYKQTLSVDERYFCAGIRAEYIRLRERFPLNIQREFQATFLLNNVGKSIASLNKMRALEKLLENRNLTTATVAKLAQSITPALLIEVVRQRQRNKYPPLPYCANVSVIEGFCQELAQDEIVDWDGGYGFIKRQACQLSRLHVKNTRLEQSATGCLVNTSYWYMAMARSHRAKLGPFANFEEFSVQFKHTGRAAGSLLRALFGLAITIAMGGSLIIGAVLLLNIMPLAVPFGLLTLGVLLPILANYSQNKTVHQIANILSKLSFFVAGMPVWMGIGTIFLVRAQLPKLSRLFSEIGTSLLTSMTRLFKTLFSSAEHTKNLAPTADLKTKTEESIMRLSALTARSANKKAALLETVWDKIDADITEELRARRLTPAQIEREWERHLNQEQEISHEGRTVRASFYQLASLRRDSKPFDVPEVIPPVSRHGFFATTTMRILSPVQGEVSFTPR